MLQDVIQRGVFGQAKALLKSAEVHVSAKAWSESLTVLFAKSIYARIILFTLYLTALVLMPIVESHCAPLGLQLKAFVFRQWRFRELQPVSVAFCPFGVGMRPADSVHSVNLPVGSSGPAKTGFSSIWF
jgi:hypothetical protein